MNYYEYEFRFDQYVVTLDFRKRRYVVNNLSKGWIETVGCFVMTNRRRTVLSCSRYSQNLPLAVLWAFCKVNWKVVYVNMENSKSHNYGTVEVTLWPDLGSWEFFESKSGDYVSGCFICLDDSKVVIDYDGVFELPQVVKQALIDEGYDLSQL